MDFHNFFSILNQSIKLLTINKKPMLLLIILSLFLSSILFLIYDFSAFSIMRDMLAKESMLPISSSQSSEFNNKFLATIRGSTFHLLVTYFAFVLFYLMINLLITIATIVVTSESYHGKKLLLHELLIRVAKSCKRSLITGFYTTIFVIGYIELVLFLSTPLMMPSSWKAMGNTVLFWGLSYIVYLYLSVVRILSLVVSVLDEDEVCGLEALGRSAKIVKGHRICGFLVNVVVNLVTLGVYFGVNRIKVGKFGLSEEKVVGLFLVNCSFFLKILTCMVYTILYFRWKRKSGEDKIELGRINDVKYEELASDVA